MIELPQRLNLASYFVDRNVEEGRGARTALICGERSVTYSDLAALVNRAGNALREVGVRAEERVLLAASDGIEWVAAWYGAQKIGAVTAEAYTFLPAKDFAYLLDYTRAGAVVADATTLPALREAAAGARWLRTLLVLGVPEEELRAGELSFDALLERSSPELEAAPTGRDDVALWKFTTGSTGAPKAAAHLTHDPVVSFETYGLGVLGLRADDLVLGVPKLFFGYARDIVALFSFGVGGCGIVFADRATPERMFDLVREHRPTVLVQVPTMMRAMLDAPHAADRDLSSLRLCTSSGETLPAELYRRWRETFGVEVLDGIGSSEAYHIFISNRPGAVRPGSAGQVVPGYEARLVDQDGADVPEGEPGELWITGDSTALCYWGEHEKSKRTFAGDTVRTGDLFARDADGFFHYRGRADDLLKVSGMWVAPLEIETCLAAHPAVAECAVVGVEQDGLAAPWAFVVLAAGAPAGSDELAGALQDHVRARLAPHKYPRAVRFVDALPRTANGKVDRRALRQGRPEGAQSHQDARPDASRSNPEIVGG